jgi:hypothetical protein
MGGAGAGGSIDEKVHNCPFLGCEGPNGWRCIKKKTFLAIDEKVVLGKKLHG